MLEQLQREDPCPIACSSRKIHGPSLFRSWTSPGSQPIEITCCCTVARKRTGRSTLDALQNTLDRKLFVRINRGTLVRLGAVRELLPWFHGEYKVVLHDNTELRWSRRYVSQRPEILKLP